MSTSGGKGVVPGGAAGGQLTGTYPNPSVNVPLLNVQTGHQVTVNGADPTGVADSTAAINATIAAVQALGGGVVWCPAGTYKISGTLLVTGNNVFIDGEGCTFNYSTTIVPLVEFRNTQGGGISRRIFLQGNFASGGIALQLTGALYGVFDVRGDAWFTGVTCLATVAAGATQNTANNDIYMQIANGVAGMVFRGDGTYFASNNRIHQVTWAGAGSVISTGIDFQQYADTNKFDWVSLALNLASSIGVIYNSATPGSDTFVYENDFALLIVEGTVTGTTAIKGNVTNGTATRPSYVRYRLSGTYIPAVSIGSNSDVVLYNSNDGSTAPVGQWIGTCIGVPTQAGYLGQPIWRLDGTIGSSLYECTTAGAVGVVVWTARAV